MSLVLAVLVVAVLLGWVTGGSLERLSRLQLHRRRFVVVALAAQLTGTLLGGPAYAAGLALSAVLVAAFLLANRGVRGTGLVGLGLAANALVVGLNGAMPVQAAAAGRAGVGLGPLLAGQDPRHELLDEATRLPLLGDVVPVPLPGLPQVISPGDVLVAAGVGQLVLLGMRSGRSPARRPARR